MKVGQSCTETHRDLRLSRVWIWIILEAKYLSSPYFESHAGVMQHHDARGDGHQLQAQVGNLRSVPVSIPLRQPTGHHVGVIDRLHLVHLLSQIIQKNLQNQKSFVLVFGQNLLFVTTMPCTRRYCQFWRQMFCRGCSADQTVALDYTLWQCA